MTNKEYLEGVKEAEEKRVKACDIDFDNLVCDERNDEVRKVKALEIIAEELCKLNAKTTEDRVVYKIKKAAIKIDASIPK